MTDTLLADQPTQPDPNADYWKLLAGEGGKFHDQDETVAKQKIAKGKYDSDLYIKHLEARLDESREDYKKLRDEYNAGPKLQELIDRLTQQTSSETPPANVNVQQPAFKPEDIESLVSNKIQQHELTKRQTENFNQVKNKLTERFGPNYQTAFRAQMDQLGLDENFVNDLAKNHPSVLYRTFGLDTEPKRENFQAPPRSTQTSAFAPSGEKKRTWSYYENMRKNDPMRYKDPKTQVQMHHDAVDLGDAFNDGDWTALS